MARDIARAGAAMAVAGQNSYSNPEMPARLFEEDLLNPDRVLRVPSTFPTAIGRTSGACSC
jgi:hypothetical protein